MRAIHGAILPRRLAPFAIEGVHDGTGGCGVQVKPPAGAGVYQSETQLGPAPCQTAVPFFTLGWGAYNDFLTFKGGLHPVKVYVIVKKIRHQCWAGCVPHPGRSQ